jgi:hypothetical protein
MKAEMLGYSRSRGIFAGLALIKRRQPDMSQRHPAIFLNVFAVFFTILSHRALPGFPVNSGSMPPVAWNL